MRVVLASASPRRKELLQRAGVAFEVLPATGEEIITGENPPELVMELAFKKAKEVAGKLAAKDGGELLILGADTVVTYDGAVLGKPRDEADAVRMLSVLSGSTHSVFTGVALIYQAKGTERVLNFYQETRVTMYPMSPGEIQAYVRSGEPMDKAGAYGIQGRGTVFIEKIAGDYNNVVGLPMARVYQEMKKLGVAISENVYYD